MVPQSINGMHRMACLRADPIDANIELRRPTIWACLISGVRISELSTFVILTSAPLTIFFSDAVKFVSKKENMASNEKNSKKLDTSFSLFLTERALNFLTNFEKLRKITKISKFGIEFKIEK